MKIGGPRSRFSHIAAADGAEIAARERLVEQTYVRFSAPSAARNMRKTDSGPPILSRRQRDHSGSTPFIGPRF